jgi:gas vesicle protein
MAAATLTAGKSGDELRMEFERFRREVQKGDMDALGSHLEERFKELQAGLEQRISAISDAAKDVQAQASEAADSVAEGVSEAVAEGTGEQP